MTRIEVNARKELSVSHDITKLLEATESVLLPNPTFATFEPVPPKAEPGAAIADYVFASGDPSQDLTVRVRIAVDGAKTGRRVVDGDCVRYSIRVRTHSIVTNTDGDVTSDQPVEAVIALNYPANHPFDSGMAWQLLAYAFSMTYAGATAGVVDETVMDKLSHRVPGILG